MNGELKKKLIDAGYEGINGNVTFELSELIEACGDKLLGIVRADSLNEWCAVAEGYPLGKIEENSPEEAVANLWLKLKG